MILNLPKIFFRSFLSAFLSLKALKWKSLISIITILIGAMAITATFTISHNVDTYVNYLINLDGGPSILAMNQGKSGFDKEDINYFKNISSIKHAFRLETSFERLRLDNRSIPLELKSVTDDNWKHLSYHLKKGHFISKLNHHNSEATVVLSSKIVNMLKLSNPIGKKINFKIKNSGDLPLRIVGVADPRGEDLGFGMAWVNHELFQVITGKKALTQMKIVATDSGWMNWVEEFSQEYFDTKFGMGNVWVENPLEEFLDEKNRLLTFINMGYALGFLALLGGTIGSTSVMILNVNVRRREIGLYKAMGYSSGVIILLFICETLILCFIGGFMGSCAGTLLGQQMSLNMFNVSQLSAGGFFLGLLSALVTGLLFGLIPATMAARTDAVKALQG
jgi:ABC-type antimicrobial peptide transport system permease subunit